MTGTFKKLLSLFLAASLLLGAFGLHAFAADAGSAASGRKDNTIETAVEVTGSFTATVSGRASYYKFTPAAGGCYRLIGALPDIGVSLYVYDGLQAYKDGEYIYGENGSFWNSVPYEGFDGFLNLEAGRTYYLELSLNAAVSARRSASFGVDITHLGTLTGSALLSPPDKRTYIRGVDDYAYTSPDAQYYEFYFDAAGLSVQLSFSEGQKVVIGDYTVERVFEKSYDCERRQLGENTVYFSRQGEVAFSFVITLIENPVKSIEVVRPPDKTDYVCVGNNSMYNIYNYYSLEINPAGMQVKINYTDTTSKTVTWTQDDNSCYWLCKEVDGYGMYIDGRAVSEPGEVAMTVHYLGAAATFTVHITEPPLPKRIANFFFEVFNRFARVLRYLWNIPVEIFYILLPKYVNFIDFVV